MKYKVTGIPPPGRIRTKEYGEIDLYSASDDQLHNLYLRKCKFIEVITPTEKPKSGKKK